MFSFKLYFRRQMDGLPVINRILNCIVFRPKMLALCERLFKKGFLNPQTYYILFRYASELNTWLYSHTSNWIAHARRTTRYQKYFEQHPLIIYDDHVTQVTWVTLTRKKPGSYRAWNVCSLKNIILCKPSLQAKLLKTISFSTIVIIYARLVWRHFGTR